MSDEEYEKVLDKVAANRKSLLTIVAYKELYASKMEPATLKYFDFCTKEQPGVQSFMLLFDGESDWVPGGPFEGNYGVISITDFTKYKNVKGRKRVDIDSNHYDYVDSPDMHDLIPYELETTQQIIDKKVNRKKRSIYSFEGKYRSISEKYKEELRVYIGGQQCFESELSDKALSEVLASLTPQEYSKYLQSLYNIDISLYPSIEFPVRIRIDGCDDGAQELLVGSVAEAKKIVKKLGLINSNSEREHLGFKNTD